MSRRIDPACRCKPLDEWPQPDQAAWAAALQPSDDPDRSQVAEHWSADTRRTVVSGHGRWLTFLDQRGQLAAPRPPDELVTPQNVAAYLAMLRQDVAQSTVLVRVEQLVRAMRAMAPARDWHWLQQIAADLRADPRLRRIRPKPVQTPATTPPAALPRADRNAPRSQPLAAWPPLDQAAWTASLRPGDVFEPGGVAAGWAAATQTMVVNGYGHWLTWLAQANALDPALPPAGRVSRERLLAYCGDLQARVAPFTVAARVEQLGNALRALAPEQDWRWILRAVGRLRAPAVSVRRKPERLQSPEKLVAVGRALMEHADDPAHGPPTLRAGDYRDGLMIALLALRPMRRRNLAAIRCGQHLLRRGTQWWLRFRPGESKTKPVLEFSFPAELVANLDRYLHQHRPVLLARGGQPATPVTALWVSLAGTHMGPAAISHQIRHHTGDAFDEWLNPHLFRDCAATAIAINAPSEIGIVRAILGHTSLATAERHYNLATSLEAGRRYGHTIDTLRSGKRRKTK